MDTGDVRIAGVDMTAAAARNVEECRVNVAEDVELLRSGRETGSSLLETCMDGAESNRKQGWRDYVSAVVRAAAGR